MIRRLYSRIPRMSVSAYWLTLLLVAIALAYFFTLIWRAPDSVALAATVVFGFGLTPLHPSVREAWDR